jgi:hypothetical protein
MRIIENSPSQLRLRDHTFWVSILCVGMAAALAARFLVAGEPAGQDLPTGAVVLLALGFAFGFLHATDVTIDKPGRTCAVRRLDGFRLTRVSLRFDEIADIRVEIEPMPDSHVVGCRLALVTASGVTSLTAAYQPSLERFNQMRETILEVVKPGRARAPAPDPVRELARAGRTIDAVALLRQRERLSLADAKARVEALRSAGDA